MRLAPVMLALLLALSPVAVAVQASAPPAPDHDRTHTSVSDRTRADNRTQVDTARLSPPENASERNTTSVMALGSDPSRTAFGSPSLALGSSLRMDRGAFRTQLTLTSLDQQLQAADTVEKQKQILNRYRYRIENRIISLKASERRATQAFSNGTLSKDEYLRTLGRIDVEAGQIRSAITELSEYAGSMGFDISERSLKAQLAVVEGPVRDRIEGSLQGRVAPTRVHVAVADSGVVLSTIVDGTYIRETFRSDNRDPSKQPSITVQSAMEEVIRPRYPWVSDSDRMSSPWGWSRRTYQPIQSLRYTYYYPHGNLTAYVDTGTAEVYREIQYKQLTDEESLPLGPSVSNTEANVTLTVNRTYSGGPLRVKLTDGTGSPIQGGEVTVAGDLVGRTGPDGVLWTLAPDEQFSVSASYDFTTVNVTTTPTEPP